MAQMEKEDIRSTVREHYGSIAALNLSSCGCSPSACCGSEPDDNVVAYSEQLGYSATDVGSVPDGANLGLGCGNPTALANLKPGEKVLDLGSGAGFDAFLASQQVGPTGFVIGVDMTPEMIKKARQNALKGSYTNVQFRLGEIEQVPVETGSIDTIISNCVINLSPDKEAVFHEAYRVLKPGGRLAISDIVSTAELPPEYRNDPALHCACMAGAETIDAMHAALAQAGFREIRIEPKNGSRELIRQWAPGIPIDQVLVSASIEATKPQ